MIVHFSITPEQLVGMDRDLLEERVSVILRAHRYGEHLAIFPRRTALWLLSELYFIGRDKGTLQRLQAEATQTGDLVRRATMHIEVVETSHPLTLRHDKRAVCLPLDHLDFLNILKKPVLILEDIVSDRLLYDFIFRNLPSRLVGCPVAYEALHGGGDRIWHTAKVKSAERRIVVAVADSDLKSPVSPDTKRQAAARTVQSARWPLLFWDLTPCAEVENMLSLDVYGLVPRVARASVYSKLVEIEGREVESNHGSNDKLMLFFDIKKGISPLSLSRIGDQEVHGWISQKLRLVGLSQGDCHLPGFGEGILNEVFATGLSLAKFRDVIRSQGWHEVFGSFVCNLMWLLAAPSMKRT